MCTYIDVRLQDQKSTDDGIKYEVKTFGALKINL